MREMDEYKSLQEWIQSFLVPTLSLRVARQKRTPTRPCGGYRHRARRRRVATQMRHGHEQRLTSRSRAELRCMRALT